MTQYNITYCRFFNGAITFLMIALLFFSACSPSHKDEVDELNSLSYAYHYRNLDSTKVLAQRALRLSDDYPAGFAEAHNNLAFVDMAKMNYAQASKHLEQVERRSDNQIEILIAHVQNMRLCQRESRNKDFYAYREKALRLLRRIGEEADNLPERERKRVLYARSEFDIVTAAYFYYVGQEKAMIDALDDINADQLEQDTAQYLNYLYNIGSGGAIVNGTAEEICQTEFDYLMRCFMLASSGTPYPYWQANSLQAISEHLESPKLRNYLIRNNKPAIKYLNIDQVPDSLLAGNLAQTALNTFISYGDVYQIAGGYRTLAECYWAISDYRSAGECLNHALYDNKAINAAPDLVASICERLCLVYSAIDDKPRSDYNLNIYLDLQERTRQDRQLEARAALLDDNSVLLNWMIAAVVGMIIIVLVLLYVFDRMRRKNKRTNSIDALLEPLEQWKQANEQRMQQMNDRKEELEEDLQVARIHVLDNKKRHLEQRAKVALVNSIMPFIDRMINEVDRLKEASADESLRQERLQYISELTDKINQYNHVLTEWIQMRQGALSLHVSSFALQPLFDIVGKARMSFARKGVELEVIATDAVVKADRTLTLFMINTITDNARKFTHQGGKVTVSAIEKDNYVEVRIADTGKGMDEEQLSHLFDRTYTGGHGFGLLNCKGIIEKYKKVSSIFSVCSISAESQVGKGSILSFRLPKGLGKQPAKSQTRLGGLTAGIKCLMMAVLMSFTLGSNARPKSHHQHAKAPAPATFNLQRADAFADSAYFSNINGHYQRTLQFADSARHYLNAHYLSLHPGGKVLMQASPSDVTAAEIKWYTDSLPTNYYVILDLRNESAVAALALHKWDLYRSNNKVYTQLYREMGTDNTLPDYVRTMQVSENSKTVAIVLLIILLLQLPLAYYLLYYRHVLSYRFAVEKVNDINKELMGDDSDQDKLSYIGRVWKARGLRLQGLSVELGVVVEQIEAALRASVKRSANEKYDIEMVEDELHKVEYENARIYVSNSVLDNTLSALKHETMYYPSRIRQLVTDSPDDIESLHELVDYYKALYGMLSTQAMEQTEKAPKYDPDMVAYLCDILSREGGGHIVERTDKEQYCEYVFSMPRLQLSYEQVAQLFTPLTVDVKFLLCRQIVREIGEATNMRGCGISAHRQVNGEVRVVVILAHQVHLPVEAKLRSEYN